MGGGPTCGEVGSFRARARVGGGGARLQTGANEGAVVEAGYVERQVERVVDCGARRRAAHGGDSGGGGGVAAATAVDGRRRGAPLPDVAPDVPHPTQRKQVRLAQPRGVAAAQRGGKLGQPLVIGSVCGARAKPFFPPLWPPRDGRAQLALPVLQPLVAAQRPRAHVVSSGRRRAAAARSKGNAARDA
jgi:hypothetical protein